MNKLLVVGHIPDLRQKFTVSTAPPERPERKATVLENSAMLQSLPRRHSRRWSAFSLISRVTHWGLSDTRKMVSALTNGTHQLGFVNEIPRILYMKLRIPSKKLPCCSAIVYGVRECVRRFAKIIGSNHVAVLSHTCFISLHESPLTKFK